MATTYDWKGGNGAFNNAAKWKPYGVPGLDNNANFASGGTVNGGSGGLFEVAQLSVEAKVTFASVGGSYAPDVDATNGLSIEGGSLTLDAGSVLNTGLSGIQNGQPPASAYIDDGGKLVASDAHLIVNAGGIVVGGSAAGTLTLNKSAVATFTTSSPEYSALTFGNAAGSSGTLNVGGKSSLTVTEGGINFGYAGAAKVMVSGGGTISTDQDGDTDAAVGLGATSTGSGSLLIEGAGSAVTIGGGGVNDGFSGKGSVTVESGASLSTSFPDVGFSMGASSGGSGSLTVNAATFTDDGELFVGDYGTGKYLQEAGATASIGADVDPSTAPAIGLGVEAGSSGTANITGAHTSLDAIGQVDIGLSGKGSFSVLDGAAVTSGDSSGKTSAGFALGIYTGSSGTAKISGAGATLTNTGLFVAGSDGTGAITIADGGAVTTSIASSLGVDGADLGAAAGASGTLTVGTASSFTDASDLIDGVSGKGALNASGNSMVIIGGALELGQLAGGKGSATVSGGAELSVGGSVTLGVSAKSTGVLTVTGAGTSASELLYGGTLAVGAAGAGTLNIAAGALAQAGSGGSGVITIGLAGSSTGKVTVAGTLDGTSLTMGRHSSGTTTKASLSINGGTVNLTGDVKVNDVAAITLNSGVLGAASLDFIGGSLMGDGTINAAVTAPAITASGGTLDIAGAITGKAGLLTLDSGASLDLGSTVASSIHIDFAGNTGTTLQSADPTAMHGLIEGFAAGSTIDLLGVTSSSFSYNTENDHLSIKLTTGSTLMLDFSGAYTKASFEIANYSGGIAITHS